MLSGLEKLNNFRERHFPGIKVFDILEPKNHVLRDQFFRDLPNLLADHKNDQLILNYVNLKEDMKDYRVFTLCYQNNELLGFSGLMGGRFGGCARALTRTFYTKKNRQNSLVKKILPNLATAIMLPVQVEYVLKNGLNGIFVSMQGRSRELYFYEIFRALNTHWSLGQWEVLDGWLNTCPPLKPHQEVNNTEACWQKVAWLNYGSLEKPNLPIEGRK